jgi:hypothetical protein
VKKKLTVGSPFGGGGFFLAAFLKRRRMSVYISSFTDLPPGKQNTLAVKKEFPPGIFT